MGENTENYDMGYQYFTENDDNSTFPSYFDSPEEEMKWIIFVYDLVDKLRELNFIFCAVGLIINCLNCLVISHRKMWTSSINVLMIGISFCDVFIIGKTVGTRIYEKLQQDVCWPESTYLNCLVTFSLDFLAEILIRITPFLGLSMAIIRVIMIYFPLSKRASKLTQRKVGYKIFIVLFVISFIISVWYNARFSILESGLWVPRKKCGYPKGYSQLRYTVRVARKIFFTNATSNKINSFLNGALNIISAVLYPLIALILVVRLLKVRKVRENLQKNRTTKSPKKEHTKTLVVLLSITFFISQLPFGISLWLVAIYPFNTVINTLACNGKEITSILFTINATAHCIIFAVLSTQYCDVARERFFCWKKKTKTSQGATQSKWKSTLDS